MRIPQRRREAPMRGSEVAPGTRYAGRTIMRPSIVVAALVLPMSYAAADRVGGSGGGGPLSQTSSGISAATGGSSGASSGGSSAPVTTSPSAATYYDAGYDPYTGVGTAVILDGSVPNYTGDRAQFELYAGVQKVHDSDGSWNFEASVTDFRLRIKLGVARYYETLTSGDRLTMTMPQLTIGWRIDDLGATAVYLEGGGATASTKGDPMADSSITGPLLGTRVEHRLGARTTAIGDAAAMWFGDGVRAYQARIGLRYGPVEGSVRVLDFNVGPPLYGPELGLRF
jgi:hypothetical protein